MITPTSTGPNPFARSEPGTKFPGANTVSSASTSAKPPMTSDTKLAQGCRMAGDVEKTASLLSGSGVTLQCGKYASHTITAPRNPPATCAAMYMGTLAHGNLPLHPRAIVPPGLRCAPLRLFTA